MSVPKCHRWFTENDWFGARSPHRTQSRHTYSFPIDRTHGGRRENAYVALSSCIFWHGMASFQFAVRPKSTTENARRVTNDSGVRALAAKQLLKSPIFISSISVDKQTIILTHTENDQLRQWPIVCISNFLSFTRMFSAFVLFLFASLEIRDRNAQEIENVLTPEQRGEENRLDFCVEMVIPVYGYRPCRRCYCYRSEKQEKRMMNEWISPFNLSSIGVPVV